MISINLQNKTALVTGVADNVGFGWHIAKTLQAADANVIISCHPRVKSILDRYLTKNKYTQSRKLPFGSGEFKPQDIIPCDVAIDSYENATTEIIGQRGYENDISIEGMCEVLKKADIKIDILIHSVAFSPEIDKNHLEVSRRAYLTALSVSSYSLVGLTRSLLPLMNKESSVVGLSYLAGERVVPFYGGGMASAKAALECDARMLSWFIGEHGHRINIISAGPYASRAAKSIGDVEKIIEITAERSPLRRPIEPQDVANSAMFLCSNLAKNITGEVLHVDAGFHAMGT